MAITSNSYTGNGSTTLYSFTFPYLDQSDVKVSLNGSPTTAYTFANATTIQFTTAPGAGVAIRIYRETDDTTLQAVFSPGSSIRASDLNSDFDQLLYLGQESSNTANSATTTSNTALTTANTALSTSNTALSNSSTAVSTANSAVSTANAASSAAASAVSTANTASSNASAAVTTANAASSAASTAVSTANTALGTANSATGTANTALSTANTASTNASNAVTTANTASSNATTAVATANAATTTANNALSTANTALSNSATAISTANSAIAAVASAVIYTPVANLTALAALTPTNGDYFELTDSTGAESSALITGVTVGLVGAPGLTFRLRYDAPPGIFTFLGYFANDSETRYLKLAGGTVTGNLEIGTTGSLTFEGSTANAFETTVAVVDPTADRTITLPNVTGTVVTTGDTGTVTSTMILDGTIVDGDVNASAAIAHSKLANITAGSVLLGNATNVPTATALSGDVTVNSTGVTAIGTGVIVNADVNASAAIDGTKISPNFGSQNVVTTGTSSAAALIPTGSSVPTNGTYLPAANAVAIATNSTERLRIDSSGRLGLGTSSPGNSLLHVNGDMINNFGLRLSSTGGTGRAYGFYFSGVNSDNFILKDATANVDRITLDSSGRVGIGSNAPAYAVDVAGVNASLRLDATASGNPALRFYSNTGNVNQILFGDTGDDDVGFIQYDHGGNNLTFGINAAERFRCDSSGRFLVGTSTAPTLGNAQYSKLVSQGNTLSSAGYGSIALLAGTAGASLGASDTLGIISFGGSNGATFAEIASVVDATPGANDFPGRLTFSVTKDGESGPTERFRIANTGIVTFFNDGTYNFRTAQAASASAAGIDLTHSSTGMGNGTLSFRVWTNGNVVNTNNSYGAISDAKLKENIVNAGSQWTDLKALQVRKYNLKEGQTHTQIGLVAQEVELVSPGLVSESPDRDAEGNDLGTVTKSVNYSVLYMKAVKALQEAMERIETLEAKVAALETA